MKKVVFALAVVFAAGLVSCGNKQAEAVDTDTVAVEEVAVVADSNDTTVAVAAEEVAAPVADSAK